MAEDLQISKSEFIEIFKNRGKHELSEIDDDTLLEKVGYLKKQDLIHLATIRGLVFNETSLDNILHVPFKDVHKKNQIKLIDDLDKYHQKHNSKNIIQELYRKNNQIINELKRLKRLKRSNLAKKENISKKELDDIRRLSDLPTEILRKLVQLRNVDSTGLKRSELLCSLMQSEKHHKENKYLNHLQADPDNEIKSMIIKMKKFISKLGMLLNKSERNNIRKRLNETDRERSNRRRKRTLLDELTKIFNDLNFKKITETMLFMFLVIMV